MRFRLAGINNQNFIMQDEETGTWWQQVNGRAFLGPLKGRQLRLVPADIVAFGTWKTDHPKGRVLAPDPGVEARDGDYVPTDWERDMARTRVVTTLPKGSAFRPRALVVGVDVDGRAKAYRLEDLRAARVLLDVIGTTPVMLVIGDDDRSVRVFDRRVDGRVAEFAAVPPQASRSTSRVADSASLVAGSGSDNQAHDAAVPTARVVDFDTASEWEFSGRAVSGPLAGRQLRRVPHLLEYWFDWQTYHPKTDAYRPWRPVRDRKDPLFVPRPPAP
jgi:hypothetical protein